MSITSDSRTCKRTDNLLFCVIHTMTTRRIYREDIDILYGLTKIFYTEASECIYVSHPKCLKYVKTQTVNSMLYVIEDNRDVIKDLLISAKDIETTLENVELIEEASRVHLWLSQNIQRIHESFSIIDMSGINNEIRLQNMWHFLDDETKEKIVDWAYVNMD